MIKQAVTTGVVLVGFILLFELTNVDIRIQDHLYNFELARWIIDRDSALIKFIFYDGVKAAYIIFIVTILISLLLFRNYPVVQIYKHGLYIVLLSIILVPLLVGSLKATTNIPCPKDIERYGGQYPYVTLFQKYPDQIQQLKRIKCYPAGHASGGFALLSLYFLFKNRRAKLIAVVSVMLFSWSIASYKMLIGDHFLSHNVISMLLAWLTILIIVGGDKTKAAENE